VHGPIFVPGATALEEAQVPARVVATVADALPQEQEVAIQVETVLADVVEWFRCDREHLVAQVGEDDFVSVERRLDTEDFHKHGPGFSSLLTNFKSRVNECVAKLTDAQKTAIRAGQESLQRLPGWGELNQDEKGSILAQLDELKSDAAGDLRGLRSLINQELAIQSKVTELQEEVRRLADERQRQRLEEERDKAKKAGKKTLARTIKVPASLNNPESLDGLIRQLQSLRSELALYSEIEVTVQIEE